MTVLAINFLDKLDQEDKKKVSYFIRLLLNKSSYSKLSEEIAMRRNEIENKETLSHEEIWDNLNV